MKRAFQANQARKMECPQALQSAFHPPPWKSNWISPGSKPPLFASQKQCIYYYYGSCTHHLFPVFSSSLRPQAHFHSPLHCHDPTDTESLVDWKSNKYVTWMDREDSEDPGKEDEARMDEWHSPFREGLSAHSPSDRECCWPVTFGKYSQLKLSHHRWGGEVHISMAG